MTVFVLNTDIQRWTTVRCKACNNKLKDHEMMSKNPKSHQHEEMCRFCINASYAFSHGPQISSIQVPLLDILPNGPLIFDD